MANVRPFFLMISVIFILTLTSMVSSTGQFFVGLLHYNNSGNIDFKGNCCGDVARNDGTCVEFCALIFEITVSGLDKNPHTRRLSNKPVSDKSVISFSASYEGINPVSFNFSRWPDAVNITVNVYDQDGENNSRLVDQFYTDFIHQGADHFYILKPLRGQRSTNPSSLTILFRYMCDKIQGPICFTDCMDHADTEICPTQPPPSGTDITISDPFCGHPDNESLSGNRNCSTSHVTAGATTGVPSFTKSTSTKRDGMPTFNQTTATTSNNFTELNSNLSSTINNSLHNTKNSQTSVLLQSSLKTKDVSMTTKSSTSISIRVQETIPKTQSTNPTVGTPPTDSYVFVDKGMTYWPAIVGGVLGGLALLAAAGFLVYYKRQKKLQKRQEIYNVNPKILRKFEEYAENGTSGRADVPLETEQV